jgi:DNA primase large subunit
MDVLDRAEDRILRAITDALVIGKSPKDDVEIASFPIAVMMVAKIADSFLKGRYALAEAKRVSNLLVEENAEKIIEIAYNFNWNVRSVRFVIDTLTFNFALHFTDFLRNSIFFRNDKWKLVNRILLDGEVYLRKNEIVRLLEEEVRKHIEKKLEIQLGSLPSNVLNRLERLKTLVIEKNAETRFEETPKIVVTNAFPPCIGSLYVAAKSGRRVSHIGRFTLTSFLANLGMNIDDITNLFSSSSDFNEKITHYQVSHIAGGHGSRTKYVPPQCGTLRTHGICINMDEICKRVRHPLAYYTLKFRTLKTEKSK